MRNQFAKTLTNLNKTRDDLFLIYGDIGNKLFDEFKSSKNSKYINAGVAEPSMVTLAAGIAKAGFIPIVYTINSFLYLKSIEQIKLDVCYPNLPVVLIGTGGGLGYSELGTTHHSLEDYGILSTIPNLQVLSPADTFEVDAALNWAIKSNKPTYIRIGKKGEGKIHETTPNFDFKEFGPFPIYSDNNKTIVISTGAVGSVVKNAISKNNLAIDFWSFPSIKPINRDVLLKFSNYEKIFIVEEHNSIGGLGNRFISLYVDGNIAMPEIIFLNTGDQFHTGLGSISNARSKLSLDEESLKKLFQSNE